ncbi:MAG: VCBS repeat-containing protein [Pirellulaceae bacterium]|nr:VCBS repeat-containing protein [Pirellulaceae bacterium]
MNRVAGESFGSDLAGSLKHLLSGVKSPREVHSKVKVFRASEKVVNAKDREVAQSLSYVHVWGLCDDGTFQINTTWRCLGERAKSDSPRLATLTVLDYEEVTAGGPMFADCTEAIMANSTFRQQLLPGVDHWLGTIDRRLGMDIGGWQGLAVADVNGDGLDDLYCCQPGGLPNRLYLQRPDGTCFDHSAAAGLDWLDVSHSALFVDLDNDGDQDAVVGLDDGVLILANDGQARFTVRAEKILPAALPYSLSAADYDADGDLDIYICCYERRANINQHIVFGRPVPYHDANNGGRNVLLRNDITPRSDVPPHNAKAWYFSYVTKQVGLDVNNRRFSYASAGEDYDDDGDLDLYVANDFGRNNLFRNDSGHFVDIAEQLGVEDIAAGMSACWGDYNNDGFVDLYVSNMFSSAGNRISFQDRFHPSARPETRATLQRHARGNTLFKNVGDGTFRDVSEEAKVVLGRWAWGARFADLNGDGWQDLVVANGFITQGDSKDL